MFRVDTSDGPRVLRIFPPEHGDRAAVERDALEVARAGGLPVPEILGSAEVGGTRCLMLSWTHGTPLAEALPGRSAVALGAALGALQARMAGVAVPRDASSLRGDWVCLGAPAGGSLERALRARASRSDALLHLDVHPMNVLVTGGAQITGVIDWTNARAGDPAADFARTYAILEVDPHVRLHPHLDREMPAFKDAWRRAYEAEAGRVDDLPLLLAWAGGYQLRDLTPRAARPDARFPATALEEIRAWTRERRRDAGLS